MSGIPVSWRWPRALSAHGAMFIKEFLQLRRDRLTFGTMIFASRSCSSRCLASPSTPTPSICRPAVLAYEDSDIRALHTSPHCNATAYFEARRGLSDSRRRDGPADALRANCSSASRFRRISTARSGAATGPRCWSSPMPPIPSPRRWRSPWHWTGIVNRRWRRTRRAAGRRSSRRRALRVARASPL